MLRASEIVEKLNLKPHPDGGFYFETFRDHSVSISKAILPPQYKVDRAVSTAIYFMLPSGCVARLHRIPCAETFHHYMGDPITVMELNEMNGEVKLTRVGPNLLENEKPQHTVPPYTWFGSFPTKDITVYEDGSQIEVTQTARDAEKHYSLIGVTCAPAFQYEDSESAKRSDMLAKFSKYEPLISLLTIPD
ncbi:uncharacterized protein LOC130823706 [Amaranthus tricolor]|uniref:uncharacterized protein LOC130823706 n=1 Tax=Amaranthus tricolor TaxID=29722 RepID=UPI0025900C86|nr:uncharacterized protein LOC130823706 [Amaranthus tricolor]